MERYYYMDAPIGANWSVIELQTQGSSITRLNAIKAIRHMAVALSSDASKCITKVSEETISFRRYNVCNPIQIRDDYEVDHCAQWAEQNGFHKLALQFPDELLQHAYQVATAIQKIFNGHIYVLADTTYNSCCVDEIAAEHASVDAVIHFGSSCLSTTKRLPLLLVFPKYSFQLEHAVTEIKKVLQSRTLTPIVLLYDVGYAHAIELLYSQLEKEHSVILSKLRIPHGATAFVNEHLVASFTSNEGSQVHSVGGREFWLPTDVNLKGCTFLYVGCNGRTLSNIMLTLYQCQFLLYDPLSNTISELASSGNKSLMKRYYLVECARDAKTVAILVGTLGIAGYMDMIDHLRKLASLAGKKSYTIVVGKPNPAKLANFPEIDVFILVACPESTIIDQKEFYKPIITPHEFVLACTGCQEGMDIVTNFGEILPGGVHHIATLSDQPCETSVSLVSGGIRQLGPAKQDDISESSSLATRGNNQLAAIHSGAGGEFLMNRTWRGLERHQGEDPISSLVQGKHGIATSYQNENSLFEKPNN